MSMPHDPRPTPRPQAASGDPGDPHDHHDPLLVAQFVGDDVDQAQRAVVAGWLATCAACVDLAADLRELSAGLRALPPVRRTRDFRLTESDAARLRRARWRSVIDGLTSGRLTWAQPVGVTLAALGIVGLLVGTFSLGGPATISSTALDQMSRAGAGAAPVLQGATNAPGPSAAAATPVAGGGALFGPSAAPSTDSEGKPVLSSPSGSKSAFASASPAPAFNAASVPPGSAPANASSPATTSPASAGTTGGTGSGGSGGFARDLLLAASFVLVVVGLGLLALRFVGRRQGAATGR